MLQFCLRKLQVETGLQTAIKSAKRMSISSMDLKGVKHREAYQNQDSPRSTCDVHVFFPQDSRIDWIIWKNRCGWGSSERPGGCEPGETKLFFLLLFDNLNHFDYILMPSSHVCCREIQLIPSLPDSFSRCARGQRTKSHPDWDVEIASIWP